MDAPITADRLRLCLMSVQTPVHVIGGMAEHTTLLARLLAGRGHEVTLITTRHPDGRAVERAGGVEIVYLAATRPGSQRGGWWRESARTFLARHRARPFDAVLSQSTGAAALVRRLPPGARPPVVVISHGTAPQIIRSLVTTTRRHPRPRALAWTARKVASYALDLRRIERPLYTRAAAVLAFSDVAAASVRRWFPAAGPRVRMAPYVIDTALFTPDAARRARVRARLGLADADRVTLSVGVLSAQKGIDVAIDAIARARPRLPRLRLLVVGDGDEASALRALAARRGVADAVHFAGRVAHAETVDYYNAADLFVMSTLRVESFGLVLAEAMACGLPVIASRIGATAEVVQDGETGLLVPPGRAAALGDAIVGLFEDPGRAGAFGRAGRERAAARWGPEQHVMAILDVIADVVTRR